MVRFRNRRGTPVDPVPAFVVSATLFLVLFAWGPAYLLTLGVSIEPALAILSAGFVVLVGATYHQLIWTATPGSAVDVPVASRVSRVRYGVAIAFALIVLFSLPLLR